jgi:predicted membrane protein
LPEWVTDSLTVIFGVATLAVVWTWFQALANYRAVRDTTELREFTRSALFRMSALLVAQTSLFVVGILTIPSPRADWHRAVTSLSLVVMALAIVGVSVHEYLAMRSQLRDE